MDLSELKKDNVFSCFCRICQIPHGSGNEAALSRYLLGWATGLGYEAVADAVSNVFIRVPASAGQEDRPPVLLQAHMDMVCEKRAGSAHDFKTDPIPLVIEGDLLTTGGETTLGADNGIGVALAMALLEDRSWSHPELEILFTTNEEEDFSGAAGFRMEQLRSRLLINLDHVKEGETICGSCGGMRADLHIPMDPKVPDPGAALYRITVGGLKGGHSGDDIHRGRGNANILMGRLMHRLQRVCDYQICGVTGGTFRLAIPREACFAIAVDPKDEPALRSALAAMEETFRKELPISAPGIHVTLEPLAGAALPAAGTDPKKLITAITLIPDGIHQMNEAFEGIVDTSDNLGEVYLEGSTLHLVLEIRSAAPSLREYLFEKMVLLAELLGGSAVWADPYPSWSFRAGSPLQQHCADVYKAQTGGNMAFATVHAGLEVSYFLAQQPELDAVSLGPDIWDFHSPSERVSISSTKRVYDYLKALIGQ